MKNVTPASACFFYIEQFFWVKPERLPSLSKQFAFVFLDQQPLNSHSFTFKAKVLLCGLQRSSIVQTSLFALQSERTYSEATLQKATLKYTWSYYLLNTLLRSMLCPSFCVLIISGFFGSRKLISKYTIHLLTNSIKVTHGICLLYVPGMILEIKRMR